MVSILIKSLFFGYCNTGSRVWNEQNQLVEDSLVTGGWEAAAITTHAPTLLLQSTVTKVCVLRRPSFGSLHKQRLLGKPKNVLRRRF